MEEEFVCPINGSVPSVEATLPDHISGSVPSVEEEFAGPITARVPSVEAMLPLLLQPAWMQCLPDIILAVFPAWW